jgi:hypothetical protein
MRGVRDSRATAKGFAIGVEKRPDSLGRMQPVSAPKRANAGLKHGGQATVALAQTVRGVKRELCKRLGVRYAELSAAGREAVDLYARARAKLAAIDRWLEKNPMLDSSGTPAPCLAIYSTLLNTSARLLAQVLATLEHLDRADDKLTRYCRRRTPRARRRSER